MPSLARAERAALLALLRSAGPDAPTLCEGWTTHDLAAHLVAREHRPDAVLGLVVKPLGGLTERAERSARTRSYDDLVSTLEAGMPLRPPVGLPGPFVDLTNLHEFFVHHEDVRRLVAPGPRPVDEPALDAALWKRLRALAPGLTKGAGDLQLTAVAPEGRRAVLHRGSRPVELRGTPRELFLWLFGRRQVAEVELVGDADAVRRAGEFPLAV